MSHFQKVALLLGVVSADNVATVKRFYEISNEINEAMIGSGIIPKVVEKHEEEFAAMWGDKVECAVIPTSPKGFDKEDATFMDCAMGFRDVFKGMTTHNMDAKDIASTPDGKVILTFEVDDVSKDGVRYDIPTFNRFEFDDAGKFKSMLQIFNPSLLDATKGGVKSELLTPETTEENQLTPAIAASKFEMLSMVGAGVVLGSLLTYSMMRKREGAQFTSLVSAEEREDA
jgi:hypothetical protein